MYGETWTGDVWRVTLQEWQSGSLVGPLYVVGTQLLGGVTGQARGVNTLSFFKEFLGISKPRWEGIKEESRGRAKELKGG